MKLVILAGIGLIFCTYLCAQSTIYETENNPHIILSKSKNNRQVKELYVGDKVRLCISNSNKIKGTISSIDSAFFVVNSHEISYDEITKISTRKVMSQVIGVAILLGGITSLFTMDLSGTGDIYINPYVNIGPYNLYVFAMAGSVGVAMILPNYYKIGKFRLQVVKGY